MKSPIAICFYLISSFSILNSAFRFLCLRLSLKQMKLPRVMPLIITNIGTGTRLHCHHVHIHRHSKNPVTSI